LCSSAGKEETGQAATPKKGSGNPGQVYYESATTKASCMEKV